ncbi:DUF2075 domain-containing protein [Thermoclostridium stercorarium]|uniref:DNA/RNA helicase domain-containing protein n=1 Tax=Thermoclostridium stercorarium TaxID=1510 RepID=UPI0004B6337A|nr:DNA/RNA helicase domain-containing protein [Thermoclostridium stercorarium]UZQ84833.1 DUF2075 domain-containing protein [Thermoclostridium stercorarium]
MRPSYLVSVYQGEAALDENCATDKRFRKLKSHEISNLRSFCEEITSFGCNSADLDGYFVGYSIPQIGKEFDLLRFGNDNIINIELKSEFNETKIVKQMKKNYYYLKFLSRPVRIFCFVDNNGFYEYDITSDSITKIQTDVIAQCIKNQFVDYSTDPDKEFLPSKYLISPFNSTDKFINGEYFLTNAQQKIKDEIKAELGNTPFTYFCLSANAGTGKTLLIYDIAKEMISNGLTPLIIHCGNLNLGHNLLKVKNDWNIYPIKDVDEKFVDTCLDNCSVLFVDEAQRIRDSQLEIILKKSIENEIPIIFSYDKKQFLHKNEGKDIAEYLRGKYPEVRLSEKHLSSNVRTNNKIASFINNLFKPGSCYSNLDYDCITIEYFKNLDDMKNYVNFLRKNNWTPITYTTFKSNSDPYEYLADICPINAHNVIGQEFPKVVSFIDNHFYYGENGELEAEDGYYSAKGMLYQIVTRAVEELKIIVFNNWNLYHRLLEIKFAETK